MNKPWFKNGETTDNTKFWGLTLDNTLNWKMHIDLTLSKLNNKSESHPYTGLDRPLAFQEVEASRIFNPNPANVENKMIY